MAFSGYFRPTADSDTRHTPPLALRKQTTVSNSQGQSCLFSDYPASFQKKRNLTKQSARKAHKWDGWPRFYGSFLSTNVGQSIRPTIQNNLISMQNKLRNKKTCHTGLEGRRCTTPMHGGRRIKIPIEEDRYLTHKYGNQKLYYCILSISNVIQVCIINKLNLNPTTNQLASS